MGCVRLRADLGSRKPTCGQCREGSERLRPSGRWHALGENPPGGEKPDDLELGLGNGPEGASRLADSVQRVEEVASRARQAIQSRDDHLIAGLQALEQLRQHRTVSPGTGGGLAEDLGATGAFESIANGDTIVARWSPRAGDMDRCRAVRRRLPVG